MTHIQDLQNKVNSLSDTREFYDPETASRSGATHVPSQPSTESQNHGLPHDTRNIVDTSGNVFERLFVRERRTSTLFNNPENVASYSQELRPDFPGNTKRPESEMRREPKNSSILVPRFQSGGGMFNQTGGTYSHGGMIDYPNFF